MASEDIFAEDFSEEIISELEKDYVEETVEQEDATNELNEHDEANNIDDGIAATELNTEETAASAKSSTKTTQSNEARLFQLPLTRIRNIMRLDPDLNIASNEAVFLTTRATELFIQSLAVESYTFTAQAKKKTVQKRDVDLAIAAVDSLMFLDGAMAF